MPLGVCDVERDHEREARVADDLHGLVALETVGEDPCARLLRLETHPERPQAPLDEPGGVGRGNDAGEPAGEVEAVAERLVAGDGDASDDIVVAGEDLGRAVDHEIAAMLERPHAERRGDRRVADTTAGCATAASKSGIVSSGFAGASSRITSTSAGGAPV